MAIILGDLQFKSVFETESEESEIVRAIWEGELCNCVSHHSSATMLRCESSQAKMTTRCPNSGCLIEGASLAHI